MREVPRFRFQAEGPSLDTSSSSMGSEVASSSSSLLCLRLFDAAFACDSLGFGWGAFLLRE